MGLIAAGGLVGPIAALLLSRLLESLLFGVGPHDPISFIAVVLVLVAVAILAILIPALSAMKTNPGVARRVE